jgi:hypothetical protein
MESVICPFSRVAKSGFGVKRLAVVVLAVIWVSVAAFYLNMASKPALLASTTVADGPFYEALARWVDDGFPSGMRPTNVSQPLGYPVVISLCHKTGVGLVLANVVLLAVGLAACWSVLRRSFSLSHFFTCLILALFAMADVSLDLSASVASECAFFCASMATLWALQGGSIARLLLGCVFCFAAISIRTAGVALIPAVLWAIASRDGRTLSLCDRRVIVVLLLTAVAAVFVFLKSDYYSDIILKHYHADADWIKLGYQQLQKLSSLGEIATNQRAEEYATRYRDEFALLGALVLILVTVALYSRRAQLRPVDVYFVAYVAVLFTYPFFFHEAQRRFVFPVVPLLCAYLAVAVRSLANERALNRNNIDAAETLATVQGKQ